MWPLSLPFTFVFLKVFLGSGQVTFPEGVGEKLLLISDWTNCVNLPSPFSPPRTMIAFLMRILFKNYSLCFPPPPGIYFLLSPFPFFHHLKLHVLFLVTSHGWSAAWFFPLPVASWQVADPAVDEEPGASMWGGGGGAWRKR